MDTSTPIPKSQNSMHLPQSELKQQQHQHSHPEEQQSTASNENHGQNHCHTNSNPLEQSTLTNHLNFARSSATSIGCTTPQIRKSKSMNQQQQPQQGQNHTDPNGKEEKHEQTINTDKDDHTVRKYHESFSPPTMTKYQLEFPKIIEKWFSKLDDRIIPIVQKSTTGIALYFSTTFTFFTSIEVSLVFPPTLYSLGYDKAAGLCSSVLFVLGVLSQIPKKFIFRPRPWMVSRAKAIRRDKTSSFPSRAVVCSVVFTWLIAWSLVYEGFISPDSFSSVLLWFSILIVALFTAFARINVGAHYPSDTMLGFLLGCFIVKIGLRFEDFWKSFCMIQQQHQNNSYNHYISSNSSIPYFLSPPLSSLTSSSSSSFPPLINNLSTTNNYTIIDHFAYNLTTQTSSVSTTLSSSTLIRRGIFYVFTRLITEKSFLSLTLIFYIMTLISIQGFWVKCSYVYGLLMSCFSFRATFLCQARFLPNKITGVIQILDHGSFSHHIKALVPVSMLLFFGMLTRGKKGPFRIISFTLIYVGSLIAMLIWRLRLNSSWIS